MSRAARIRALERTHEPAVMPFLSIGRTDRHQNDAVGFHDCDLRREPGEAWDDFCDRVRLWAWGRPAFVGRIIYRD